MFSRLFDARIQLVKYLVEPRAAAQNRVVARDNLRARDSALGNQGGREVAAAHVLRERPADGLGNVVRGRVGSTGLLTCGIVVPKTRLAEPNGWFCWIMGRGTGDDTIPNTEPERPVTHDAHTH